MITQEELKRHLEYNPNTGVFTRRLTTAALAKQGDVAGTLDRGYIAISIKSKVYRAHRLAWLYIHGEFPTNSIDHIDMDRSNNRLNNLRLATQSQNLRNTILRKDNTSGVKNVTWKPCHNKWQVKLKVNGKELHLGHFETLVEASKAAEAGRVKYYGEFTNHGVSK